MKRCALASLLILALALAIMPPAAVAQALLPETAVARMDGVLAAGRAAPAPALRGAVVHEQLGPLVAHDRLAVEALGDLPLTDDQRMRGARALGALLAVDLADMLALQPGLRLRPDGRARRLSRGEVAVPFRAEGPGIRRGGQPGAFVLAPTAVGGWGLIDIEFEGRSVLRGLAPGLAATWRAARRRPDAFLRALEDGVRAHRPPEETEGRG